VIEGTLDTIKKERGLETKVQSGHTKSEGLGERDGRSLQKGQPKYNINKLKGKPGAGAGGWGRKAKKKAGSGQCPPSTGQV